MSDQATPSSTPKDSDERITDVIVRKRDAEISSYRRRDRILFVVSGLLVILVAVSLWAIVGARSDTSATRNTSQRNAIINCQVGIFLSGVIQTSLANPTAQPPPNPVATAQAQVELNRLNAALVAGCRNNVTVPK